MKSEYTLMYLEFYLIGIMMQLIKKGYILRVYIGAVSVYW